MIVYGVTGKLLSLDEILKKRIRSREMNNACNILMLQQNPKRLHVVQK
jgi:hypothetical protein